MKFCHCALPALTGNNDCCKNCPNNEFNNPPLSKIQTDEDILSTIKDWNEYEKNIKEFKEFKELLLSISHRYRS